MKNAARDKLKYLLSHIFSVNFNVFFLFSIVWFRLFFINYIKAIALIDKVQCRKRMFANDLESGHSLYAQVNLDGDGEAGGGAAESPVGALNVLEGGTGAKRYQALGLGVDGENEDLKTRQRSATFPQSNCDKKARYCRERHRQSFCSRFVTGDGSRNGGDDGDCLHGCDCRSGNVFQFYIVAVLCRCVCNK